MYRILTCSVFIDIELDKVKVRQHQSTRLEEASEATALNVCRAWEICDLTQCLAAGLTCQHIIAEYNVIEGKFLVAVILLPVVFFRHR